MDEKLNSYKIRGLLNMSYCYDAAEAAQEYQRPFDNNLSLIFSNLEEVNDYIRALYRDNSKDQDILQLTEEGIHLLEDIERLVVFEKGRLFTLEKEIIGHGGFRKRTKKFDYSPQTIASYMRIFKVCLANPEWVFYFKKSVLEKITSKSFPKDLRKHLFETGRPNIKNKEINEVLKLYKAGKLRRNSPEIKALCRYDQDMKNYEQRRKKDRANMAIIKNFQKNASIMLEGVDDSTLTEKGKESVTKNLESMIQSSNIIIDNFGNESDIPVYTIPRS
jgi:hypothetical protein